MSNRTVKVTLSAQVQQYVAGMEQAAKATRETGTEAEKLAQQKQALQTLGAGMLAVGGAITAVGVAALKTGIDYNTMQQTSRAALLTMLGSSQAVNEQMAKLDDFARNSPFSKQTFLAAQQQMLAFGIETQKVIPYLDAVQNAVAAAGGSNADIEAIVATMSKIQSSAKITAQDLNEFGNRGVNAAELIGSQMGKTGAEIRSEITAGTLGATEALDALAAGMSERFDGAAANVKQTFEGAMDRVKAAWRDFSAELARPLVDPEGGGMLVDMLNGLADAMRGFEKLPGPVKDLVSGLVGIAGATALIGGAAIVALPQWVAFKDALAGTKFSSLNLGMGKVLGWGAAIAAATVAVGALVRASEEAAIGQAELVNHLTTSTDSVKALDAAASERTGWSHFVAQTDSVKERLADLPRLMESVRLGGNDIFGNMFSGRTWGDNASIEALNTLHAMGDALAEIAATDLGQAQRQFADLAGSQNLTAEHTMMLLDQMPALRDEFLRQAGDIGIAADSAEYYDFVMGKIGPTSEAATKATEENSDALAELEGRASSTSDEIEDLADVIRNFGVATLDVREANRRLEQSFADFSASVEENGWTLENSTEQGRKNEAALDDMVKKVLEATAATYEQTGSQEEANAVFAAGRERILDMIQPFFESRDAAAAYIDQLGLTPDNINTAVSLSGTEEAERQLRHLSRDRFVRIATWTDSSGAERVDNWAFTPASANGNIFEFANGGGLDTGIYRGGTPITRFAEPETVWEAFISGKPDQRERNRQIWVETGNRLDVFRDLEERIVKALGDGQRGGTTVNYTSVNPVYRDDFQDAWDKSQETGF